MKIGLIQMSMEESWADNCPKAMKEIRKLSKLGAEVICLPELFHAPYFPVRFDTSNFIYAVNFKALKSSFKPFLDISQEYKNVLIVPFFEEALTGVYYNSVLVIEDGNIIGRYRKTHLPDDPNFYEKYYFTPGDLGFPVFETKFGRIGVLICWDQWFPEPARIMAMKGAEIIFYPTAIGYDTYNTKAYEISLQKGAWMSVQRGNAVANGIFIATANRVGHEHPINFWGQSFVCRPNGEIVQYLNDKEDSIIQHCDLIEVSQARHDWPFLRDRRLDLYGDITKGYIDE